MSVFSLLEFAAKLEAFKLKGREVGKMFRKKQTKIDPLAEMRSAIDLAIDNGRAAGLRHYQLAEVLEQAAQAIKLKHAMASPIL